MCEGEARCSGGRILLLLQVYILNYSFRTSPKEIMIIDASNYTRKGEKSDCSDIWKCLPQDLSLYQYLKNLKHDDDVTLRIRIYEDQWTEIYVQLTVGPLNSWIHPVDIIRIDTLASWLSCHASYLVCGVRAIRLAKAKMKTKNPPPPPTWKK